MNNILIMIPAYNPNQLLLKYIEEIIQKGYDSILVINDGSKSEYNNIFDVIAQNQHCKVFNNVVNCGKGRALKNGFLYYLNNYNTEKYCGIITVDSDGQHGSNDIIKIKQSMLEHKNSLILGARNFNETNIPLRSSFGNKLTSRIFKLLYGQKLIDTQTGFRGIPNNIIKEFISLEGERFEYETNMLIKCAKNDIPMVQTKIETIYIDNNSESHFNPIVDSFKIYTLLFSKFFKYIASSVSSFIIDVTLFQLFVLLFATLQPTTRILTSTILARVCSSIYNYNINKKFVFNNKQKHKKTVWKYYTLCILEMSCSGFLVSAVYKLLPFNELITKIFVDTVLFLTSFVIQKNIVFKQNKKSECK